MTQQTPREPEESEQPDAADSGDAATEAGLEEQLVDRQLQYLRLAADFENFKRRKVQELADRARYSNEEAAIALLPVLDNLRRAIEHAPEGGADQTLVEGLRMVVQQFEVALSGLGVSPVASVGEVFDPAVHQAIGGEDSDDVAQDTVVEELQSGYRLYDRLLRPAMVRVAHPRRPRAPAGD